MAADKLSLYQAKRDFTKTAEPSGTARVKPAKYPALSFRNMPLPGCITIFGSRWTACSSPGPSQKARHLTRGIGALPCCRFPIPLGRPPRVCRQPAERVPQFAADLIV